MTPDEARAEKIRDEIANSLSSTHPGQDVKVWVGPVPFGNFLWEEKTSRHVSVTTGVLFRTLGFSHQIKAYLRGIPTVKFDQTLLKAS